MSIDIKNIKGKKLFIDGKLSMKKVLLYSIKVQFFFICFLIITMTINHFRLSNKFGIRELWNSFTLVISDRFFFISIFFVCSSIIGALVIFGFIFFALKFNSLKK